VQSKHVEILVAKSTVEYVPATQFVHEALLPEDHEPAEHRVHEALLTDAENDPAVQLEHPVPLKNVPAKQLIEQAGPVHAEELQTQTPKGEQTPFIQPCWHGTKIQECRSVTRRKVKRLS
jgi:hypothetical protein